MSHTVAAEEAVREMVPQVEEALVERGLVAKALVINAVYEETGNPETEWAVATSPPDLPSGTGTRSLLAVSLRVSADEIDDRC